MTTKTKKATKNKKDKNEILVNVENLKMYFPVTSGVILQKEIGQVKAVDNLSFLLEKVKL